MDLHPSPKLFSTKKKENINVTVLTGDRMILSLYRAEPIGKVTIVNPHTGKPFESEDWDRWPLRGKVVYVSAEVTKKHRQITVGSWLLLESLMACSKIPINGQDFAMTRLSNVILVYEEKVE